MRKRPDRVQGRETREDNMVGKVDVRQLNTSVSHARAQ